MLHAQDLIEHAQQLGLGHAAAIIDELLLREPQHEVNTAGFFLVEVLYVCKRRPAIINAISRVKNAISNPGNRIFGNRFSEITF